MAFLKAANLILQDSNKKLEKQHTCIAAIRPTQSASGCTLPRGRINHNDFTRDLRNCSLCYINSQRAKGLFLAEIQTCAQEKWAGAYFTVPKGCVLDSE